MSDNTRSMNNSLPEHNDPLPLTVKICSCTCGAAGCASTDPVIRTLHEWSEKFPNLRPTLSERTITSVEEIREEQQGIRPPRDLVQLAEQQAMPEDYEQPTGQLHTRRKHVIENPGNLGKIKNRLTTWTGGDGTILDEQFQRETLQAMGLSEDACAPGRRWTEDELLLVEELALSAPVERHEIRDLALLLDRTYAAVKKQLGRTLGHHTTRL